MHAHPTTLQRALRVVSWTGLLLPGVTTLSAAELVVRDLYLGGGSLPPDIAFSITDDFGTREGEDSFSDGYQLVIGAAYSLSTTGSAWGLVPALEIAAGEGTFDPEGTYSSYSARVSLGFGRALGDSLHLEVGGYAGYGLTTFEYDGGSDLGPLAANGSVLEYGARGGIYWALSDSWRVGVVGVYGYSEAVLSGSAGGMGVDLEVDGSGIAGLLTITYRFSSLPGALE